MGEKQKYMKHIRTQSKMADINPTLWIIILNVNGLIILITRQRLPVQSGEKKTEVSILEISKSIYGEDMIPCVENPKESTNF